MDARTLEALKGSIEKWEKIVAGTGVDEGPSNCPLCQLFHPMGMRVADDVICDGCPVKERIGLPWCDGTPYNAYEMAEQEYGSGSERARIAADAELAFLKSLLPAE